MTKLLIDKAVVEQALEAMEETRFDRKWYGAMAALRQALSAIAQAEQPVVVPQGWKLVPVGLTHSMKEAGHQTVVKAGRYTNGILADLYSAMLSASPSPAPAVPDAAKPVRWAQCPETDTPCSRCPTAGIPCEAAKPETQGERDALVVNATLDQKRAVAVVHHMLRSAAVTLAMTQTLLTKTELDLCRQWFDAMQDTNPKYLNQPDFILGKRLYELLDMRVPHDLAKAAAGIAKG